MSARSWSFRGLIVGLLGVLASPAWALPTITGLSWELRARVDGTFPCNGYQMGISYAESRSELERMNFAVELRRGEDFRWGLEMDSQGAPYLTQPFSRVNSVPAGRPFRYWARTKDSRGEVSKWSGPFELTLPRCDGGPLDGKVHRSHAYVLVTFPDFANRIPYSPAEFRNSMLVAQAASGEAISMKDYFSINGYGQWNVQESFYGWYTLPKPSRDYCRVPSRNGSDAYGCDYQQIARDTKALLASDGVAPNVSSMVYMVNGLGEVGLATSVGAIMSANGLRGAKESPGRALPYSAVAHELLHLASLSHSSSIEDCANAAAPEYFRQDETDVGSCSFHRYGISAMGGHVRYQGVSAWHRHELGLLGPERMAQVPLDRATQFEIFDLDLVNPAGPQMIRFPLEQERNVLPERRRLVLEYSMPNQRLDFGSDKNSAAGLRVALHQTFADDKNALEPGVFPDSTVQYLADIRLRSVGDKVSLPSLRIALEVIQVKATSMVVALTPIQKACEPAPLKIEYRLIRKILTRGFPARLESQLRIMNRDRNCLGKAMSWQTRFVDGSSSEVEYFQTLISGESYIRRNNRLTIPDGDPERSYEKVVTVKTSNGERVKTARLEHATAFSVDYEVSFTMVQGETRTARVTNHLDRPIRLGVAVDPEDAQRRSAFVRSVPRTYTLAPQETRTVSLFLATPETVHLSRTVRLRSEGIRVNFWLNGKLHSQVNPKFDITVGTCNDGIRNRGERGVDCGGGSCARCPEGWEEPEEPEGPMGDAEFSAPLAPLVPISLGPMLGLVWIRRKEA